MVDNDDLGPGPVISRLRLRTELRRLRDRTQVTQEEVARRLGWSASKMIRIERGTSKLSVHDVHALLDLYGVTDPRDVERLADWARRGRRRDWWVEYKKAIPGPYSGYVGLEAEATAVSNFEPSAVPGLLQTSAYARDLNAAYSRLEPDRGMQDVNLRLHRQRQVLNQANPPKLSFVIDEAVLYRTAGSGGVMQDQLRHLAAATELPHVTLRILPFTAGLHPSLEGSFSLLEFAEGEGITNVEGSSISGLLEDPSVFRRYRRIFDILLEMSLDPEESLQKINDVADTGSGVPGSTLSVDDLVATSASTQARATRGTGNSPGLARSDDSQPDTLATQ